LPNFSVSSFLRPTMVALVQRSSLNYVMVY
jgi:hypothetical protein